METLAILAGHGGKHSGCVANGIVEKDLALALARQLEVAIGARDGLAVVQARPEDTTIEVRDRGALTKGADLVLLVHVNAIGKPHKARGLQCYHWQDNLVGCAVATAICEASPDALRRSKGFLWPTSRHDWRRDAHALLRVHKATAVLVEVGFTTDEADAAYLQTPEGQAAVVATIIKGLSVRFPVLAQPLPLALAVPPEGAVVETTEYMPEAKPEPEDAPKPRRKRHGRRSE